MLATMNVQPLGLWQEFHNDMQNWFSAANSQLDSSARWLPHVDIIEQSDHYLLTADLPGVDRKDIEIVFADRALTLKGERHNNSAGEQPGYKRIERHDGCFQRTFRLPDNINAENISAKNNNGVLEVHIPKQAKAQKKIAIQ